MEYFIFRSEIYSKKNIVVSSKKIRYAREVR